MATDTEASRPFTVTFWCDPENVDTLIEVEVNATDEDAALRAARGQRPDLTTNPTSVARGGIATHEEAPMPETQSLTTERAASATFTVVYTHDRSPFPDGVSTVLGAYSAADAEARVRDELAFYDLTILRVTQHGNAEPVICTYEGGEGAAYPEGPWVSMDWVDRWAPVIVCDVHGVPAHPAVYDSSLLGPYSGPCTYHPEPRRPAQAASDA